MEGQDGLRKEVAVPVRIWWFCSGKHMNCYIRSLLLFFVEVIVFIQFYYCREVTHLFTSELIDDFTLILIVTYGLWRAYTVCLGQYHRLILGPNSMLNIFVTVKWYSTGDFCFPLLSLVLCTDSLRASQGTGNTFLPHQQRNSNSEQFGISKVMKNLTLFQAVRSITAQ
jgi:hypothetical protein